MDQHDTLFSANPVLKTILERRSIRSFSEEPVSDDQLHLLLQAANQAPSAHNQQSWRFIVLRGERKQGLAHLVSESAHRFPKPVQALLRMSARCIASAPVVVAVANSAELISHGPEMFRSDGAFVADFFRTMEIQSSSAAVQNMLLAATSIGLATVWLGIMFLMKDEVLKYLGLPGGEFMAVVPIGHAARSQNGPPKKQDLTQKVIFLE